MSQLRSVVAFALLLHTACLWRGEMVELGGVDTRFTILHTSDIHSRLLPYELSPTSTDVNLGLDPGNAPFGGAARLGYLLKRERKRADRVLHLDSGDCFQGAPIFNQGLGEAEVRFHSMIGLDAAVIGNHEFDAGVLNLVEQMSRWKAFDLLAANYYMPDPTDISKHGLGKVTLPYAIYNARGLKIAVIGMANLGSLTSIGEGGNSLQITPMEQNETVRSYVNMLHGSVDLIIVLSHLGLTEDEDLVRGYETVVWKNRLPSGWSVVEDLGDGRVLAKVPGVQDIDIIVGGHLHTVLNPPKIVSGGDGRETIISHSGAFAKYLGRLDTVLQDDAERGGKRVVSHKYQVFPVDNRLANYEDPDVTELLEPYMLDLSRNLDLRKIVAYAPQTIARLSATGNGDSALGDLVAESMRRRRRVDAEFAVTNTLGIRDNFYQGPITLEDAFNVFPFENTLTVMYLSGREVQELADFSTERSASRGCQSQVQVAGISFTMNCGKVVSNQNHPENYTHPAEDVKINGVPIIQNGTYKLATNDYIAGGGSGFQVLKRNTTKLNTGVSLRDALIDFAATLPACAVYEKEQGICDRSDDFSQSLCREIGGAGRIPNKPANYKGPYADVPCVLSTEDGRIKRKTSEDLDTLPDASDPQASVP